jgi:hypothetical protein
MDIRGGKPAPTLTADSVAERLGLGTIHAQWLAKLGEISPTGTLRLPAADELVAALARLGAAPEDAIEVVGTMPSPERDAEAWWLLDRCHSLLVSGLANRAGDARPVPPLPPRLALFPVHLIVVTFDAIRQCHLELGIPEDISWETFSHLGRAMAAYRKRHGSAGVEITGWDWMRFFGLLYQAGCLTVIPYRLCTHPEAGPLFWYDDEAAGQLGPGFRRGDPALSLHVPPAAALAREACDDSFNRMRNAFQNVYPDESPRVATCTSWMLDEQLAQYLPPDSNILGFQRRFNLVPGARDDDEAMLRFVFGPECPTELEALPQRTTLERAVVSHLRLGGHWRMRTGWVDLWK